MDKEKENWYGQSLTTKSDPLVDSGSGRAIILRVFEFSGDGEILRKTKPSKQELFNSHADQIRLFLWKDGLEPVDVEPRIAFELDKNKYTIFVACQPKAGVALMEKPTTLQDIMKQDGRSTETPRSDTDQLHGGV